MTDQHDQLNTARRARAELRRRSTVSHSLPEMVFLQQIGVCFRFWERVLKRIRSLNFYILFLRQSAITYFFFLNSR